MQEIIIFGAKSIALGAYLAIKELYSGYRVTGFMVSSMKSNPSAVCGLPVREISCYEDKTIPVLVAIPEDVQESVEDILKQEGFENIICLTSKREAELMSRYYKKTGRFLGIRENVLDVYVAKFHRDKPLRNSHTLPSWAKLIQVGAGLSDERVADLTDDTGENISGKNVNYCELTALYWIWKNRLGEDDGAEYCGLFHYRRFLDISDEDMMRMKQKEIDVILPYPMIHEPDIREHHGRYIKEDDWEAMRQALQELQPSYAEAYDRIFGQQYMYNYNILIAKKEVLRAYCEWLFPILERTEELSIPRGSERADRYIGYLGENLLTLYFMYHQESLNIVHTGRIMLT